MRLLQTLTDRCLEMFDVTATSVLVADPDADLRLAIASGSAVDGLLCETYDNAPCLEALASGQPVVACQLDAEGERWPGFAADALSAGLRKVYAFPMADQGHRVGALTLFAADGQRLSPGQRRVAQTLADAYAVAILQHRLAERAAQRAAQLQHALDSRVVIEQAKGILMRSRGVTAREAFEAIRSHARSNRLKIRVVAQALIDETLAGGPTRKDH